MFGEAYDRVYNPVGLIQESVASSHPVIWVGVNYRVGSTPLHQCMVNILLLTLKFLGLLRPRHYRMQSQKMLALGTKGRLYNVS